jgi:NAD(P)-dependent dehydrogenase (short-subunit alcohol dehydrogenase family)
VRSLDPLLRLSEAGRAIFVTSGVARKPRAFWGAYGATKAALEQLALSYAAENVNTKIRVNLVNPGAMRTRMRAQAMPGEDPKSLPEAGDIAPLFVELASADTGRHGALVNFRETPYYKG